MTHSPYWKPSYKPITIELDYFALSPAVTVTIDNEMSIWMRNEHPAYDPGLALREHFTHPAWSPLVRVVAINTRGFNEPGLQVRCLPRRPDHHVHSNLPFVQELAAALEARYLLTISDAR